MFTREAIVSDTATYKPEALRALKAFKALKTFKPEVTPEARIRAMQTLVNSLVNAYEMGQVVIVPVVNNLGIEFAEDEDGIPVRPIYIAEKLRIITLLNRFAGIRSEVTDSIVGINFVARQKWAVNLFRKVYPRQFARLLFIPADGGFYTELPVAQMDEAPATDPLTAAFESALTDSPVEEAYAEEEETESFEM